MISSIFLSLSVRGIFQENTVYKQSEYNISKVYSDCCDEIQPNAIYTNATRLNRYYEGVFTLPQHDPFMTASQRFTQITLEAILSHGCLSTDGHFHYN